MAWIVKNSAGTQVAHRAKPYLTDAMRADMVQRVMPRYETKLAALLPALHMIQHEYGWIPGQAMLEIAELLEIQPSEVMDTASFYEEYWIKPRGKQIVSVCRSIACEACNYQAISEAAKVSLGVDIGETTDDNEFTLIEVECLGSCDSAPVALVNEKLHEWLTPEKMKLAIEDARKHGNAHH